MYKIGIRHSVVILAALFCLLQTKAPAQNLIRVQVGSADPVEYADFDEGWSYAMSQQSATITLLDNITRTQTLVYLPTVANGRHTLDLNNHTITENTTDNLLYVNKEDAKLTITDSSPEHGGCLYKKKESSVSIHTVLIYQGEIEIAGGKLYCENTIDDSDVEHWHPAVALYCNYGHGAISRISGGILEAVATMSAITVSGYSTVYITGGQIRATVTKYRNAQALVQQRGTAYISGGKLEAYAVGQGIAANAVSASAWIGTTPETAQYGEVYITGGTFLAQTETNGACAARSDAAISRFGSDIVKVSGKMYISGGSFVTRASDPSATQIFAAVSNGTRLFDEETPHHLIGESLAEMTISGGDFLVDTRDAEGKYVVNQANVDLLRNWGKLNVSGGTFTIYQYNNATGIGCYKNKVTLTGNPVFRIHGAINTRGMVAGPWCHSSYCDADASKNMAEIEMSGGTFEVVSDSAQGNTIGAWAYGGLSTASVSGDAGYAMQAKLTINGGTLTVIHPNTTSAARVFRQEAAKVGTYGTAEARVIVHNGKFRTLVGTETENTPTGRNVDYTPELACMDGGFYVNYSQLATNINDDCRIRRLTDAEPEYAEGYRFTVEPGPTVAKVTVGASERFFSSFMRPLNYAQKQNEATVTLLADIDYIGEGITYNPAPDNASTTLDLNGHTVMANGTINTFMVIDKDNATFTIKDSGVGGIFGLTIPSSYASLIMLRRGKMILEGGTLSCENTEAGVSAVRVEANGTNDVFMEMKGGKIYASSKTNTYSLLVKSIASPASRMLISGGEIEATSTGNYAFAITAGVGGHITVRNNPKLYATHAVSQAQAMRTETTGVIEVYGGRFSANPGRIAYGTSIAIRGGFYTELSGETFKNQIDAFCVPPYQVFPTTDAERATYGAEYVWKVEPLPESGFYADIIDVDNTNQRLLLNVSDWEIDGWPYTINGVAYAKTQRAADRTMTIPYSGAPGDEFYLLVKKTSGDIASHHPYTLPLEITFPTTLTANENKPLFVKGTTLTVDANITAKNIYVGPDATLCINSGKTLTADAVILRTTPASAAQLVKNGAIDAGTNVYYTRIVASKAGYFPFGLPVSCLSPINAVRLSNGTNPDYKAGSGWVLRSYDEASRATYGPSDAGANWRTHDGTATIVGGKGYEMYSGVNYYREFYFPIDLSILTDEVAVTHTDGKPTDAGWNLLVSPLTYTYSNTVAPEGLAVSWLLSDGTFEQEIPDAIPPVAAFAFQAQTNGVLSFAGSSLTAAAPLRKAPTEEQIPIQWLHLDIRDAKGVGDQTSIYAHPTRYDETYKPGIDVAKQSFTASRALLYSSHAYGEMAFAGVSDSLLMRGVPLTIYSPVAQELTISMRANNWLDRLDHVWLVDYETGVRTDLLTGDYTFDAAAGTTTARLAVEGEFPSPQISMGNELVPADETLMTKAGKFLWQNKMFIRVNGRIYDANGKLITAK